MTAGGMAFGAIQQAVTGDAFLGMLGARLLRVVLMATIAGVGGVGLHMTRRAGNLALFAMIEGEGMLGELSRGPGGGAMASRTLQSKNPSMNGGFLVTGATLAGRAPEGFRNMTGRALQRRMGAFQRKDLAVVKVRHIARAIMATHTICAILLNMLGHKVGVSASVAIDAGLRG